MNEEIESLRATVRRLNRRAQEAEGIIAKAGLVEGRQRSAHGRSLGRALANYAAAQYLERAETAERQRDDLQAKYDHEVEGQIACGLELGKTQAQRDAAFAESKALRELLEQMLNVVENADEIGYVTDVGFVDLDKLHNVVRAAIARSAAKEETK